MPVNFLEKEANDRLIAAIIGSVDNNINLKEIARIYGDSVGFNTIEWYLRKLRHQAVAMKAEADGNPVPAPKGKVKKAPAATSSPVKPTATPKKGRNVSPTKDGVKGGRVEKKKPATPKVKKEVVEDEADDMLFGGDAGEDEDEMQTEI